MKKRFVFREMMFCALLCLSSLLPARGQVPFCPIIVSDNGTGVDTLWFGYHLLATRCVDATLCEQELPPAPPTNFFDVRFVDPAPSPDPECMGQGLKVDLRTLVWANITDTLKLWFQAGAEGGYPMRFRWPAGLTTFFQQATLRDPFDGSHINVDMFTTTSFELTNPAIKSLCIYISPITWSETTSGVFGDPCNPDDVTDLVQPLPPTFVLHQSFPNPFNPTTTIRYQIPHSNFVSLKVYDALGREVTALIDGWEEAGYKSISWDARDVPSGIYFYRLVAGDFVQTRRLVLVK